MLQAKKSVDHYINAAHTEPMVSVCITAYKHEKYIAQCLDSILMQKTTFPFEICLGEDNSSDNTREICKKYADKYPHKIRLFLHHRENVIYVNGNATGRFNFLYNFEQANGKYIALCDGDDYWTDESKLQKQVDFLEKNKDYVMASNRIKRVDEQGKLLSDKMVHLPKASRNLYDLLYNRHNPTSGFIFRKANLPIPLPEWTNNVLSGDIAIEFLLADQGLSYFDTRVMSVYRDQSNSMTKSTARKKNWLQQQIGIYQAVNMGLEKRYHKAFQKKNWRLIRGRFFYLIKNIHKKKMRVAFKEDLSFLLGYLFSLK